MVLVLISSDIPLPERICFTTGSRSDFCGSTFSHNFTIFQMCAPRDLDFPILPVELQLVQYVGLQGAQALFMEGTPSTAYPKMEELNRENNLSIPFVQWVDMIPNHQNRSKWKVLTNPPVALAVTTGPRSFNKEGRMRTIKADVMWDAVAPKYQASA